MVPAVRHAIKEALGRDAMLHAVALLRGSRVLAAVDGVEGRQALADAVLLLKQTSLPTHSRDLVMQEAIWISAYVDPAVAVDLLRSLSPWEPGLGQDFTAMQLVQHLANQGLLEEAVALLEQFALQPGTSGAVLRLAEGTTGLQVRALRADLRAWEQQQNEFLSNRVYELFAQYYDLLPDAGEWLERMLQRIQQQPDCAVSARYPAVSFQSQQQWNLFQLLRPIRAYKPEVYVEELINRYPELRRAVATYPSGPPMPQRQKHSQQPLVDYFPPAWSTPRFLDQQLTSGHDFFLTDVQSQNADPRPLWRSCHEYRIAFWHIGRVRGEAGVERLKEVPDRDIELLSSIELAAGAMKLPLYNGIRRG